MYLKALELQGFKSFPEKTEISFGADYTAIVGPNGSGKSNLSDAIRWVLGEQSSKALRGGKMEDVIFGGTQTRKQLGFAEVSLVLDNTGRLFDREESEVMVTRRYYRSGESEYYINRRSVRLKDVNELFMDTGLGREGYSTIGQGRIDDILSAKSADRRDVFEEAAGISRFRHRKEEAEHRLERTQENLLRIGDKISELELQVEPLRGQAEKAKRYLIFRDELRLLEISLWMDQLDNVRAGAIKIHSDYDGAVRQKEEIQRAVEALYALSESFGAKMREKEMAAERVRFEMMQREADANGLQNAIAVLKANLANNRENQGRVQQELDQQQGRAGSLTAQIEDRRGRLDGIVEEARALRAERTERQAQAERAAAGIEEVLDELEALREKQALEAASAADAKALLSALAAAAQEIEDRDTAVRRELSEDEAHSKGAEADCRDAGQALAAAVAQRDALKNTIGGYTLRLDRRRQRAEERTGQYRALQMEENTLDSRIRMFSEMEKVYEGYSKAVKVVMQDAARGRLKGICGPVAGLIHTPDAYTVAIETALGGAMQHIVVETEEDGKAAIQHLKRRDAGRCTFLPLSSIRPAEFRDTGAAKEPGFVGMGDALIQFDAKYRTIFSQLLGRVVIAEDLDRAVALARKYGYRFKIVTLDGQVLHPGGSMTGGSVSRTAGILSRANELERLRVQLGDVRTRLAEAAQARQRAERDAQAAAYELEAAQGALRTQEDQILQMQERLAGLEQQIRAGLERQAARRTELERLRDRAAQTEASARQARARIAALEGSSAALRAQAEAKAKGRAAFQEKLEKVQAGIAQDDLRLAALEAEQLALEKAIGQLEDLRRDIAGDREERTRMLAEFDRKNQEIMEEIQKKDGALQAIQEENQARQQSIRRLNEEKLALEAQRTKADKESREKNGTLFHMEREVSLLEQKKNAAAMEEKQILERLWETYELSHEAARSQRVPLDSPQKAARRIAVLKRDIAALGNVNLDAVEEFDRINQRYTYLTSQRDDATKSKRELESILADITAEMRRIFSEQFGIINQAFGETFQELFGGGKAALELEDPDDILNCGIEIKVQPPGKALKVLSLLSGGEKAFVAIALYFAILKVRPTPFCVMDEIEAALDDANVTRFAHYLRKMCSRTQFIVITHRRGTMEQADALYGVTMQEQGVSRLLSIDLNRMEQELHLK